MNRFKTKRRAKDTTALERPSLDASESATSLSFFRRTKKPQEQETTKEIDLAVALPSSDDFRTSLLMSGLSARFSMLREQDDPSTKIGKANDDSVLFPTKRQSRLVFLGAGDLTDIAEVESIYGRPSFTRTGAAPIDEPGSIMTRAKPTDGNNLFGGRQKIYRIADGASGAMAGRIYYGDDVAKSSFQRWRQAEKEKSVDMGASEVFDEVASRSEQSNAVANESHSWPPSRSDADAQENGGPQQTLSTASRPLASSSSSSSPEIGWSNSGNVTQHPLDHEDRQVQHNQQFPAAASETFPSLDRSVTRTRRLYERGLNQELHEQQNSALTRVNTLTQRRLGAHNPIMANSTTWNLNADRIGLERRQISAKASAPNLRTPTPPSAYLGSADHGQKAFGLLDSRRPFGVTPPLSPPMSVTEEMATAYTENDLTTQAKSLSQQGSETASSRLRTESTTSSDNDASRPSSNGNDGDRFKLGGHRMLASTIPEESTPTSYAYGSGRSTTGQNRTKPIVPPIDIMRPPSGEHPAFRQSALPTPLQYVGKLHIETPPLSNMSICDSDEPTKSNKPAGLSGLVRQHLRADSNASSVYGLLPSTDAEYCEPVTSQYSQAPPSLDAIYGWQNQAEHGVGDRYVEHSPATLSHISSRRSEDSVSAGRDSSVTSAEVRPEAETEFASQLASARRRVRDKMNSYIETDDTPALAMLLEDEDKLTPPRSTTTQMLRPISSRASLRERIRPGSATSKFVTKLGMGTNASSAAASDLVAEEQTPLAVPEEQLPISTAANPQESTTMLGGTYKASKPAEEDRSHPGVKAFRNARRELQKRKELETLVKHQQSPSESPEHSASSSEDSTGRANGFRSPDRVGNGPVIPGRRQLVDAQSNQEQARSPSRSARLRNGAIPYEHGARMEPRGQRDSPFVHSQAPWSQSPLSPALLGADTRQYMNQIGPAGTAQNGSLMPALQHHQLDRSKSAGNLKAAPERPNLGGAMSDFTRSRNNVFDSAPTTPIASKPMKRFSPTRPNLIDGASSLQDSMKRIVHKSDISDPTFINSTSLVPTVDLPQAVHDAREARARSNSRSRSGSVAVANGLPPPLPPVNPRRRDGSRTRNAINGFLGRNRGDSSAALNASKSTPYLPVVPAPHSLKNDMVDDGRSAFDVSDDEAEKPARTRLRKVSSEAKMDSRAAAATAMASSNRRERTRTPPYQAASPGLLSRTVTSPVAGGMF